MVLSSPRKIDPLGDFNQPLIIEVLNDFNYSLSHFSHVYVHSHRSSFMLITPMDVIIVMFLSTLAGIMLCEAYHLMTMEPFDDET